MEPGAWGRESDARAPDRGARNPTQLRAQRHQAPGARPSRHPRAIGQFGGELRCWRWCWTGRTDGAASGRRADPGELHERHGQGRTCVGDARRTVPGHARRGPEDQDQPWRGREDGGCVEGGDRRAQDRPRGAERRAVWCGLCFSVQARELPRALRSRGDCDDDGHAHGHGEGEGEGDGDGDGDGEGDGGCGRHCDGAADADRGRETASGRTTCLTPLCHHLPRTLRTWLRVVEGRCVLPSVRAQCARAPASFGKCEKRC
eukprot:2357438-Rhodomonas_salina.2